jgi:hypothetical protein
MRTGLVTVTVTAVVVADGAVVDDEPEGELSPQAANSTNGKAMSNRFITEPPLLRKVLTAWE